MQPFTWIKADSQQDAEFKAAQENKKNALKSQFFHFAKASCVYSEEKNQFLWQVRTLKATSLDKPQFTPIFDAIKSILTAIEKLPGIFVNPQVIHSKLQKLCLYLLQAPSWPFKQQSIESTVLILTKFKQLIDSNNLSPVDQIKFKQLVRDLNKGVQNSCITIEEIANKIATKTHRSTPQGNALYKRIHELLELGIKRIKAETTTHSSLMQFGRVFSLNTYLFKSNADNQVMRNDLARLMLNFIPLTIAYDRNHNQTLLHDLFVGILEQLNTYYKKNTHFTFGQEGYSSLLWTLELLVANPDFMAYMQEYKCRNNKTPDLLAELFKHPHTFPSVSDFIVFLGDYDLFNYVFDKRVDSKSFNLDKKEINHIFYNLNKKVSEENILFDIEFKRMFLNLLEKLLKFNYLHHLIPYAENPKHTEQLLKNLKKLDFSFLERSTQPLSNFFGNAGYQAIQYTFDWDAKLTLLKLFSRQRENPITNRPLFKEKIQELLLDQEFGSIWKEVYGKMGEVAGSGSKPAEDLISSFIDTFKRIRSYCLMCLPNTWHHSTPNPLHHVALHDNQLHVIVTDEDNVDLIDLGKKNEYVLKNLQTGEIKGKPNKLLIGKHIAGIKVQLEQALKVNANRDAVLSLTETYMSFHQNDRIKEEIGRVVVMIFQKMVKDGETLSYDQKLEIIGNFLFALAPFLKKITPLVEKRFIVSGKLKESVRKALVEKGLKDFQVPDITALVTKLCIDEIEELIQRRTIAQMKIISTQLSQIIDRKIDELSYSKQEFIDSFCKKHGEQYKNILGDLTIKEQVMHDHGKFLKEEEIPIRFILPNQAIAMELCCNSQLQDKNLLLKMGTGQGKSLVIAIAALNEAQKMPNGRVFVFTSYDHLAQRDQKLGAQIFKKDKIESLCISSKRDVSRFNSNTKIIYADIEEIETIIREIMLDVLENKASDQHKNFLNTIYGNTDEEVRVILDEYDLLLYDLRVKAPYITPIPKNLMDVTYAGNSDWKVIKDQTLNPPKKSDENKTDPRTQKSYTTSYYYQDSTFILLPSVMRLSKFIANAKRVIGLSGTAPQDEKTILNNSVYFEIPSSQDPEVFGTKIQEKVKNEKFAHPTIMCAKNKVFPLPNKHDGVPLISDAAIKEYCEAIVEDIKLARETKQNEEISYQRPVLVFSDPNFNYKTTEIGPKLNIWDAVSRAIGNHTALKWNVNEDSIKKIGRSGAVTLASMKYGRGADIVVYPDIKEGLHVVMTLPVVHKRLRDQTIGRTGRMGAEGSYSAITMGELVQEQPIDESQVALYDALHELTRLFVKRLSLKNLSGNENKKWLLFLTQSKNESKINKSVAKELIGDHVEGNTVLAGFFT